MIDPDTFLHVAVGRAFWAHPSAIGVSTFIEAYPNYPYVEDKWLPLMLVAAVDAVGGSTGLALFQLALAAAVAAGWYAMQRAAGASPAASVIGVAAGLLVCSFRLEPRPDTMSHALVAVTIALVVGDVPYRRLSWVVPLLFVVWANVHGYFANGLLVLAAALVGTTLGARDLPPMSARRRARLLGFALLACLLTPYGWRTLAYPAMQVVALRDPVLKQAIYEFSPSSELLREMGAWRWTLLATTLAGAIAFRWSAGGRSAAARQALAAVCALPWVLAPPPGLASISYETLAVLVLMAVFELPALVAERRLFAPIAFAGALVLAAPIIRNVPLIVPAALLVVAPAWTRAAAELGEHASLRAARTAGLGALAAVVLVTAWWRLSDRMSVGVRAPIRTGWGIDTTRVPLAAADFIARERLPGPLLNNFDSGGYLLYRLHPARRVFIAGSTPMYPVSFLQYYRTAVVGPDVDPDRLVARHGIRTAVVDLASSATDLLLARLAASPTWALVFVDRAGAVFLRVDDETRPLVDRWRVDVDARVAALLKDDHVAPALPRELGGKPSAYPDFNLAHFLVAVGRPDLAVAEFERVWDAAPAEQVAAVGGQAALRAGRLAAELPRLRAAVARYPRSEPIRASTFFALSYAVEDALGRRALADARAVAREMLALEPDACGPYLGLAKIAALEGDAGAARRFIGAAVTRDRDGTCRASVQRDAVLGAATQ